jgi:hypothetical protein
MVVGMATFGPVMKMTPKRWHAPLLPGEQFATLPATELGRSMFRVFLSSTFLDLAAERRAVESALHRMSETYIGMEHFGSFSEEPLDHCLLKVRAANVFILVLAEKYGYVPDNFERSMTEHEYIEARRIGLTILPYEKKVDDSVWRLFELGGGSEPGVDQRLTRFKSAVQKSHGVSWFSSPEDLAWKVVADLYRETKAKVNEAVTVEASRNAVLFDPLRPKIDELIDILVQRAGNIESGLRKFYRYAKVKNYLGRFRDLHQKHIESLRCGNIIQSHELLSQIHSLSEDLESDEFWARHQAECPGTFYSLSSDAFKRGRIICGYIAGSLELYSDVDPADARQEDSSSPVASANLYMAVLRGNEKSA